MRIDADRERLLQTGLLNRFRLDPKLTEMVTVYQSDDDDSHHHGIYCALIPLGQIDSVLSNPSWDFSHGQGIPGTVKYHNDGVVQVEYLRYGDDKGIEPLVIDREFCGIRNDYKEISEEFRLFHRLYHDRKLDQYFKIDDSGNEDLIAVVEPRRVQIRLKEIRQFLAIKGKRSINPALARSDECGWVLGWRQPTADQSAGIAIAHGNNAS